MAEDNDQTGAHGARRFRLPKLFADNAEGAEGGDNAEGFADDSAGPNPAANVADLLDVSRAPAPTSAPASGRVGATGSSGSSMSETTSEEILEYVAGMAQELLSLREKISGIADQVGEMNARESTQEKVFDTLHAELGDYKRDFIYEHLKPVVRPLLFLYDSLEQFDGEVKQYERPGEQERRGLAPHLVRENVGFFRDQLVEALRVCEVVRMEGPEGTFNPKVQKAIGVEPVGAEQDNTIVRVVRSGWYLNGQLLRPAEVVVGKSGAKTAK
jgi:molecular chaperone GrpE (heat shock protein)